MSENKANFNLMSDFEQETLVLECSQSEEIGHNFEEPKGMDFYDFKIMSLNFRGSKDDLKMKHIMDCVFKNHVDACLIQYTWLNGTRIEICAQYE